MHAMTNLAEIHQMLPGSELLNIALEKSHEVSVSGISSDTRKIQPGEFFIALSGEHFDAHQFLGEIAKSAASAAMISNPSQCPENLAAVCVTDTREGLGQLAKAWRAKHPIPLALVTGSNGKTTVKEMIAAIFRSAVGESATLVTQGNLNNDIGLPLTLLRLRSSDHLAVIELGMNHPGETAELAAIAQANIALINNAQREHQEFMASVAAVAQEHSDVLKALPLNGVAVFPADSEYSSLWKKVAGDRKVIDFALSAPAAVSGVLLGNGHLQINTDNGSIEVQLKTLGLHNASNALAAAAVALAANLSLKNIQNGLEAFSPVSGRMQSSQLNAQCTLIDDSYNANPDSVRAAIDALKQTRGASWLVLGDMGEVGEQGPAFHHEVGVYAAQQGIDQLFAIGEQSQLAVQGFNEIKQKHQLDSRAMHFAELDNLQADLALALKTKCTESAEKIHILIKGSRFMRMERVVKALQEEANTCS
ncbi:UDP-N-acetylmuramoyl-tripeptide--D-alanyl-D-alanine ligase [Polynucleobacter sp. MWH-P3-07-1]|uniref:UDP-N-acetylmuramoyl-tripeptide--D-alanyl-D- alanine ligase n=1 Tax=Polynucleobacter sp. MWH-P3-07-1 TaxID=1743173 RepID=UPI001BFE1F97|nr:UDP-N-acetylmuramoyl-tripeptide--D-alanyl-D-alanine ligase [Polynucleobacter sp. MWH-P3-07-1]QWD83660.1 UDP-N-acetylmuramoyl-tripeptide--D-alanyl-D-alanine ligase [Polynucleobacter sp. MWH-P3-07-1]